MMRFTIMVIYDSSLSSEEELAIKSEVEIAKTIFPEFDFINKGSEPFISGSEYSDADYYVKQSGILIREKYGRQVMAPSLTRCMNRTPWKEMKKEDEVKLQILFTSSDLTAEVEHDGGDYFDYRLGWTFGQATVRSLFRFHDMPYVKKALAIRAQFYRGLGELFGLGHCQNPGCLMQWAETAEELLSLAEQAWGCDQLYCSDCLTRITGGRS